MGTVLLENIQKSYGDTLACSNLNIEIKEGEFFTFLGPSGCGKTTTLRIIAGFVDPDRGTLKIGNQDMKNVPAEKREVGMVFQNYALFPFMSVAENVEYSLKVKKMPRHQIQEKVATYLNMVKLKGYGHRSVSELSGGEQQRVALARSLAMEPKVLLLDEPLSNLDAKLRISMRREMKSIIESLGITTIFVTHDQTEALSISDRIAVFNKGQCMQIGSPEEIYSRPANAFVARFVGDINLWSFKRHAQKGQIEKGISFDLKNDKVGKYLAIRPQDVCLSKQRQPVSNCFEGVIVSHQLTGLFSEYEVMVDGVTFKAARLNSFSKSREFLIGEKVYISVDSEAIQVLAD